MKTEEELREILQDLEDARKTLKESDNWSVTYCLLCQEHKFGFHDDPHYDFHLVGGPEYGTLDGAIIMLRWVLGMEEQ